MSDDAVALCERIANWIIETRRALHRIPELGYAEHKTARFVADALTAMGYAPKTGLAGTGVLARLDTGRPGPTVLFRADMDGLGVEEQTGLEFASEHPGRMHACGHDCHMAMLLGAARVLQEMGGELGGEVRFVFQPAEEDPGGAAPMICEGVMDDPPVDFCFALHVWPALAAGSLGVKAGNLMASPGFFYITIKGKGGHGAMPHECVDALEVGCQVVAALQRIASRQANPLEPTVVSVGSFHSGTVENAIADSAEISGTIRTFNEDWAAGWDKRLRTIVGGVCRSMGADFELQLSGSYPPVINDPEAAEIMRAAAEKTRFGGNVLEPQPSMAGEDVSYFFKRAKGSMGFLGVGGPGCTTLHNPQFTVPEELLASGASVFVQIALDLLRKK